MTGCRACGRTELRRVLDLGRVPVADHFPLLSQPVTSAESAHALAMEMCAFCGLAQLADDDTVADEPRGVEPQALRDQAADAVRRVGEAGWLHGATAHEFPSPHGGSWLPLLAERGFVTAQPADVVIDCFGIMHEPDQRTAFRQRAAAVADGGVLLIQYHSLAAILAQGQWNALRHGHFAYYSTTSMLRLLDAAGLGAVGAWEFDLYGGTVLLAVTAGRHWPGATQSEDILRILDGELGITAADNVGRLQEAADRHAAALRAWLLAERAAGRRVYAYGAASRAVALFGRAGITRDLITAVADAAAAKQGRRMPGTDVPIVAPDELVAADADRVLLLLTDLLPEVSRRYPALAGRWVLADAFADAAGNDVAAQMTCASGRGSDGRTLRESS
ncbi:MULTISPECIES: methyltransferase domain-containing protein [unclassified Mycobacterium]|uniref:methyltransferase domain-containing protein n=1 Tax=unclassified Mycobacterium TaxID=2642494 RepID=UPI0029C65D88|nr:MULTISPECIES: methyltransferase domain-containing protein [unclassified Mycobacterium]